MKKLVAHLVIALVAIVGIPGFGLANTNAAAPNMDGSFTDYRLPNNSTHTHRVYLNRGHVHITISGDGDTDLDLYVYDGMGNRVFLGETYSDDEGACLKVAGAGYFTVKVVNRGKVYNDYRMTISYQ